MEFWAFTIKYNPNDLTEDEYIQKYEDILKMWRERGVIIEHYVYESATKKREPTKLHLHGKCGIKRGIYRKKLLLNNYHIKLITWRDGGWTDYCVKNNIVIKIFPNKVDMPVTLLNRPERPDVVRPSHSLFNKNSNALEIN